VQEGQEVLELQEQMVLSQILQIFLAQSLSLLVVVEAVVQIIAQLALADQVVAVVADKVEQLREVQETFQQLFLRKDLVVEMEYQAL
jgi:hypothetical protein